jgi:hypothetical protein
MTEQTQGQPGGGNPPPSGEELRRRVAELKEQVRKLLEKKEPK